MKQEQDDCCEVINWISQQKWCTGNVGKSPFKEYPGCNCILNITFINARLSVDGL